MSEEEVKKVLKKCYVMTTEHVLDKENRKLKTAIETILELYNREKKKNKELQEINFKVNKNLLEVSEELENWKFTTKYVKENYIDKGKIRIKINRLEASEILEDYIAIPYLKELLEEE